VVGGVIEEDFVKEDFGVCIRDRPAGGGRSGGGDVGFVKDDREVDGGAMVPGE